MILAIDAGTTSMRGVLFDEEGRARFTSRRKTVPLFLPGERVEQDPLAWKRSLEEILAESGAYLSGAGETLRAIGVTAFRSPVFPIDAGGSPLTPAIMWQDRRTDPLCRELAPENERVYRISGMPVGSVFSAVKMRWLAEHEAGAVERAWKFSGVYEYLLFLLTGSFITDHSVASRSNLLDLESLDWSGELLELFRIDRKLLADLVPPGSVCGALRREAAEAAGLPRGIPVAAAGGDQQCAALGLGIFRPGSAAVNTGTGAYALCLSETACGDPDRELYTNVSAVPGLYMIEAGILTAGTIYRWFSDTFFSPEGDQAEKFRTIDLEIDASPPGANGVVLIPRFKGGGTGGVFLGLDLDTVRGDMARAVLEGIAFEMRALLDRLERATVPIPEVSVSGGMTRFGTYNRIQADIFERTVHAEGDGEATALGAWINTVKALEPEAAYSEITGRISGRRPALFSPDPSAVPLYRELGKRVDAIRSALASVDSSSVQFPARP